MKRMLSILISFLLLMDSLPGVSAMGRSLAIHLPPTLAITGDAAVDARIVTRAVLFEKVVELFYGGVSDEFTPPFEGVPDSAKNQIGLARVLDALYGWDRAWNTPVTRGQAIHVIFRLAQKPPQALSTGQYSDVRGKTDARLAQQAISWNLIEPYTQEYFGWGRAMKMSELSIFLERLAPRLSLPLSLPEARSLRVPSETGSVPASRTRTPVPVIRPSRAPAVDKIHGEDTKKKTVIIEMGSVDTGSRRPRNTKQELPKSDLLETIWGIVRSRYIYQDRVDENETAYSLADKMLSILNDPYTTFMRPRSATTFREGIEGKELSGIGAQVESSSEGGIIVVSPLSGSPAIRAGVLPGDRITHVNDESILKLNLQESVDKIRGPVDTEVKLTIHRGGSNIIITVVRDKIVIPEIEVKMQDGILIVKLYQFGERTRRELKAMLIEKLMDAPRGVILDLRNNPGGLLDGAIDTATYFLPDNVAVAKIKAVESSRTEMVRGGGPVIPLNLPMIVLVNGGSASASEIVAGALQDHKRATIMGMKTFGKGSVQEVMQFSGGEAAKITIANWLTPNDREIEGKGIIPDMIFEEKTTASRDEMLLEAIGLIKAKSRGL